MTLRPSACQVRTGRRRSTRWCPGLTRVNSWDPWSWKTSEETSGPRVAETPELGTFSRVAASETKLQLPAGFELPSGPRLGYLSALHSGTGSFLALLGFGRRLLAEPVPWQWLHCDRALQQGWAFRV